MDADKRYKEILCHDCGKYKNIRGAIRVVRSVSPSKLWKCADCQEKDANLTGDAK